MYGRSHKMWNVWSDWLVPWSISVFGSKGKGWRWKKRHVLLGWLGSGVCFPCSLFCFLQSVHLSIIFLWWMFILMISSFVQKTDLSCNFLLIYCLLMFFLYRYYVLDAECSGLFCLIDVLDHFVVLGLCFCSVCLQVCLTQTFLRPQLSTVQLFDQFYTLTDHSHLMNYTS